MLLLSGSINFAKNWKILPTVDRKETLQHKEPGELIIMSSTRMPMESQFLDHRKLFQLWMLGAWTNAWQLAPLEWVSIPHLLQKELAGMMLKLASSLLMKILEKPSITITMQRTISSTCKTQNNRWLKILTSILKTKT